MAIQETYTNSLEEVKLNLQLREVDENKILISDADIFSIIDSVVSGEFSRVNPRKLSHSYIGNDMTSRELPFHWNAEISGSSGIRINGDFIDRSLYKLIECDETERPINDALPAATEIVLSNTSHSNFFRVGDIVEIGFNSEQSFVDCAYIGFATIAGDNDLANSVVTGYDYIDGSILKLNVGNVLGEINWVTAIDTTTGTLTLLNPINQTWDGSGIVKKINHLKFAKRFCVPLSLGNVATIQYGAEHRFSEDQVTFSGGHYRAFIYLATSEVARAISSKFSRYQISTFSSDTVDRSEIVSLWEARADDYLKKFRDYYGVDDQLQNNIPAMASLGNEKIERELGHGSVYNSQSSVFYFDDDVSRW